MRRRWNGCCACTRRGRLDGEGRTSAGPDLQLRGVDLDLPLLKPLRAAASTKLAYVQSLSFLRSVPWALSVATLAVSCQGTSPEHATSSTAGVGSSAAIAGATSGTANSAGANVGGSSSAGTNAGGNVSAFGGTSSAGGVGGGERQLERW